MSKYNSQPVSPRIPIKSYSSPPMSPKPNISSPKSYSHTTSAIASPTTPPPAVKQPSQSQSQQQQQVSYKDKVYTNDELRTNLTGHILVEPILWDYVPNGARVKYFRKAESNEPKNARFRIGGFVKSHTTSNGQKRLVLSKSFNVGASTYTVAYDDIEELWKSYDYSSYIEITLILTSLESKKRQIEKLKADFEIMSRRLEYMEKKLSK